MTPEMIYSMMALGFTVVGYFVRVWHARQGGAPMPDPLTPTPNGTPTPAVPGRISIGHGELLSLLLSAFMSPPPASGMPSIPTPAPSQPNGPQAPGIDANAILAALLARLAIPPLPTLAPAGSAPAPVKT